jgi:molecular chaperone DnaK
MKDLILLDVTPLSLCTNVVGGFAFKMIPRNTSIPTKKTDIFTTTENSQSKVTFQVLQGERHMAADNKLLG